LDEFEIDREALVATFQAEADEILAHMEEVLVAFERTPSDDALLHSLFRDAHTLKGGASLVGFDAVKDLAHDLESVLERIRKKALRVDDILVTLLLRSVDVLRTGMRAASGGRVEPTSEIIAFRARLDEAANAVAAPAEGAADAEPVREAEPARAADGVEAGAHSTQGGRTLRVDVSKLDRMLNLSGEIAIARGRLAEMLERGQELSQQDILEAHRETDRLFFDLQELIMKARMVPIGPTFHQHVRTIRDVAQARGKRCVLEVEGEDVEVDTAVIEHIRDPLVHMVRNAIDHGIESPEVRAAAGKPAQGTVVLRAFHEAGSMVIQVEDDGKGLDRARIAAKAVAVGMATDPARITDEEIARVIFEPGFSTSEKVTDISGRGVGMDVVRRNVEALRGSVAITTTPGKGTCVTVRVPLTLAIIQGFRVEVGEETFILPLDMVVECLQLPLAESDGKNGLGVTNVRGKPLPWLRLRTQFGVRGERPERENVVIVQNGSDSAGVVVDRLVGESQTVIKPLGTMFKGIPGISGSSILGNGRVALILDVPGLLRETLKRAAAEAA
jgi:two-component system chemotaxis sensor kinase CheA